MLSSTLDATHETGFVELFRDTRERVDHMLPMVHEHVHPSNVCKNNARAVSPLSSMNSGIEDDAVMASFARPIMFG